MAAQLSDALNRGLKPGEEEQLKNLSQIMTSKIVHSLICHTIRNSANPIREKATDDQLVARIMSLCPVSFVGTVENEFERADTKTKEILKLQMTIVPRDYEIDIPIAPCNNSDQVIKNLQGHIEWLLHMSRVYYLYFLSQNNELMKIIHDYMPHVDYSRLTLDSEKKSLYFDPLVEKRACVFGYYVDENRRPLDPMIGENDAIKNASGINLD